MRRVLLFFIMMLCTSMVLANSNLTMTTDDRPSFKSENGYNRDVEEVVYEYGFEDGLSGWTTVDGTAPTEAWHLSTVGAYDGESWWMGDEELGGYASHRYVVMDTPEITLPAGSPTMTFNLDWHVEDPGGEPAGYSGWDGCNVRISTDGGANWTVISGIPEYTNNSLYSFGFEFGEGEGIAGWCSDSGGWQNASFDLSAYASQNVMIRWAFCSDPAYDTNDDSEMFGMRVDNIDIAGIFLSDGEGAAGDDQMVPGYVGDISGDFWELTDTNPHDGSYSMHCPIEPNLVNYLITPPIELPTGDDIEILFEYWVYCDMLDSDGDGDNSLEDYYQVAVAGDDGTWTQLHYAYNGNILVSDWMLIDQAYALATFGWHDGTCDLTPWAGQTVKLRFEADTDDNDDGGVGDGLYIDDFRLYSLVPTGPAPDNLIAITNIDNNVELTWDAIEIGGGEGWIGWDDGVWADALGLNQAAEWDVASRFTEDDMMPYVGGNLTTVKFYPSEPTTNYTVRVWTGTQAANLVAEVPVASPVIDAWNEIELPTPVPIVFGEELWVGYQNDQTVANTYPAGMDGGPSVAGLWANLGTGWQDLQGDYSNNWLIQGYIEAADGSVVVFNPNRNRNLDGYAIYRSDTSGEPYDLIGEIEVMDNPYYLDESPIEGAYNYYVVTAIWAGNDSPFSNEAFDYVLDADSEVLYHDDGTSESGYNVGVGKNMAVKFSPYFGGRDAVTLTHAKIYIETVNTGMTIVKAWDDDGTDGMPGSVLFQYPYTSGVHQGWNTIEIPETNQVDIEDGSFYLGIFEMQGLSEIGFDENSSGYSYNDISGDWEMETDGNIMVRAIIINPNLENEEEIVPVNETAISNYPNPFNPDTMIKLQMPAAGKASIKIYNLKGQMIKTILDDQVESGITTYNWNGTDENGMPVGSGIYFYKLQTDNQTISKKMVLMK